MDFFSSLLEAYKQAEINGLVDNENEEVILPPIFHTDMESDGKNIIEVRLDDSGSLVAASSLGRGERIIFPVTMASLNRTNSAKSTPHPLVDKLIYLDKQTYPETTKIYLKNLKKWIEFEEKNDVKKFLQTIYNFINSSGIDSQIFMNLFGKNYTIEKGKIKKDKLTIGLETIFLTFKVVSKNNRDKSVTTYQELHQSWIRYIQSLETNKVVCNISGELEPKIKNHRSVKGKAKIISANHDRTYLGRFLKSGDIITIGEYTSEKIHLMLKYFLTNKNSHVRLTDSEYLINWFSEDVKNNENFALNDYTGWMNLFNTENSQRKKIITLENKQIGESFKKGKKSFSDSSNYYIALLQKVSDGRMAIKYFREMNESQLYDNLEKWAQTYNWELVKNNKLEIFYPSFQQILNAAYGVERDGKLICDNVGMVGIQCMHLIENLIEGRSIPGNIVQQLKLNIRNRCRYSDTWNYLCIIALSVLRNQRGREYSEMLEEENNNRSYLYGRLLAIYEILEQEKYKCDGEEGRSTNAERYWSAYLTQPAKIMKILHQKTLPYYQFLKTLPNKRGLIVKIDKEQEKIVNMIATYDKSSEINKPLDFQFLFGYYAEKKYIYTKSNKREGDN